MNFHRKWTLDREKYLSESEVRKLRRAVQDKAVADLQQGRTTWPRFWMAIDLALGAGLRVSEIAGLRMGNLHLGVKEARLRVTGKGNRTRDVFISKALVSHLGEFVQWKRTLEEPLDEEAHLLVSSHRKFFSTRALQYCFKEALKISGLPEVYSIHACRHTYGTFLYQRTKNLRLVQKQLGHSSVTTTTVYADVTAQEAVEAVNGLYEKGGDDE